MSYRHIDSYFKNEDQAQAVVIKIQNLGGTECSVEEMRDNASTSAIPTIAFTGTGATDITEGAGIGTGIGAIPNNPIFGLLNGGASERSDRQVLLSFLIHEDKLDDAIAIVTQGGGWL